MSQYKSCPECWGRGWIEEDDPKPMSFSRPSGYIGSIAVDCPRCEGDGFIYNTPQKEGERP